MTASYCKVIETGMYTSIQDSGRIGWRHRGVPVSGPMDQESHRRANTALGNTDQAAALEITQLGPTLLFNDPTWICISGAPLQMDKNGIQQAAETPIFCDVGDVIRLGQIESGARSYLAFQGGLQTESFLASRSQFYPVSPKATLEKGAKLFFEPANDEFVPPVKNQSPKIKSLVEKETIAVYKGLDWAVCPKEIRQALFTKKLTIGSNNRMGYRIQADLTQTHLQPLSGIVVPGTIQLTPAGNLLVAMQDGQVTGGYLRILQLDQAGMNFLAQQNTGKKLQFQWGK